MNHLSIFPNAKQPSDIKSTNVLVECARILAAPAETYDAQHSCLRAVLAILCAETSAAWAIIAEHAHTDCDHTHHRLLVEVGDCAVALSPLRTPCAVAATAARGRGAAAQLTAYDNERCGRALGHPTFGDKSMSLTGICHFAHVYL